MYCSLPARKSEHQVPVRPVFSQDETDYFKHVNAQAAAFTVEALLQTIQGIGIEGGIPNDYGPIRTATLDCIGLHRLGLPSHSLGPTAKTRLCLDRCL